MTSPGTQEATYCAKCGDLLSPQSFQLSNSKQLICPDCYAQQPRGLPLPGAASEEAIGDVVTKLILAARCYKDAQACGSTINMDLNASEMARCRGIIERLESERDELRAERDGFIATLERERSVVCDGVNAVQNALKMRAWLKDGRGPYEWDDDRWMSEFAQAYTEIETALEPLGKIATDHSNCPTDWKAVVAARADVEQRERRLREALEAALFDLRYYGPPTSHDGPCGPESGCDSTCVELAAFGDRLRSYREALGDGAGGSSNV